MSKVQTTIAKALGRNPLESSISSETRLKWREGSKLYPKNPFQFCLDTFVGIEVEIERVNSPSSIMGNSNHHIWNPTEDGSLRNNGVEFVSIPLLTQDVEFSLINLFSALRSNARWRGYEFTERTSVHVHVNVLDMTMEQIRTLIMAYMLVEPALYDYVKGGRKDNIFCVPVKESFFGGTGMINIFSRINDGLFLSTIRSLWSKYTGFNLLPIIEHGTVEFRHMKGTDNIPYLLKWINLLVGLKKFAMEVDYNSFVERIISVNTTSEYQPLINSILVDPSVIPNTYQYVKEVEQRVVILKACLNIQERAKTSFRERVIKEDVNKAFMNFLISSKRVIPYSETAKANVRVRVQTPPPIPIPLDALDPPQRATTIIALQTVTSDFDF
jgi:hypothetical protein